MKNRPTKGKLSPTTNRPTKGVGRQRPVFLGRQAALQFLIQTKSLVPVLEPEERREYVVLISSALSIA
ncbi:MAG: hypothetical protein DRR08_13585 [Candidatus Parabeggiatoa sp. nov. 2]|nr:MAG: hypothetical protein B6247_07450 [Beggiatoa sp. 4572_84]RKZ59582.1 MAG: hypothetical protein DRR08_13585 [Gammaproteobacteria bacterium]HEC85144.1 hypothetical protein [Thioploca sp.]